MSSQLENAASYLRGFIYITLTKNLLSCNFLQLRVFFVFTTVSVLCMK